MNNNNDTVVTTILTMLIGALFTAAVILVTFLLSSVRPVTVSDEIAAMQTRMSRIVITSDKGTYELFDSDASYCLDGIKHDRQTDMNRPSEKTAVITVFDDTGRSIGQISVYKDNSADVTYPALMPGKTI